MANSIHRHRRDGSSPFGARRTKNVMKVNIDGIHAQSAVWKAMAAIRLMSEGATDTRRPWMSPLENPSMARPMAAPIAWSEPNVIATMAAQMAPLRC